MSFGLTIHVPFVREFSLTPTMLFLEAGKLNLHINLWDIYPGAALFGYSKHEGVTPGRSLRLGTVQVEVSYG